MLLAYLDESYDQTFYWITAVVCHETALIPITQGLDEAYWKGGYPAYPGTELHGHDLFHGKNDFERLHDQPRRRIKWYADALQVIGDQPNVGIIIRGVHRQRLLNRYGHNAHPPHDVVLEHLLERVDEYAEKQGQPLLVIADEHQDAKRHRSSLWDYQRSGTWGYRSRVLKRVVDTMHYSPSGSSRLLQAADLISFLHHRISSGTDTDQRAVNANNGLWARIQPLVQHAGCWHP
ncbi:DUF3800 domain-containing protein [Mycobacterium pseudokansasii]|uniref:DUF3800 domain-containing protein n=1 Tax=Mycobacterium pseudokansasii TaxID=2341080 RepID=UPI0007B50822|nr:DUF3800 domain-containing protein [Mycobacterium pseudokansasii]KZS65576.1 hypothetical protein A4G27_05445 [Mycobacterium kansasii]VAZ98604.1 hypothetical protein LAUMK35_04056 [Mycobacterium pseudokansasii]VBA29751.1 hypothetical protein LAUMK21_04052 [Mycobacterium pseudokansasii]